MATARLPFSVGRARDAVGDTFARNLLHFSDNDGGKFNVAERDPFYFYKNIPTPENLSNIYLNLFSPSHALRNFFADRTELNAPVPAADTFGAPGAGTEHTQLPEGAAGRGA